MDKTQPNKLTFPYQMQNDSNGVMESLFLKKKHFQHTTKKKLKKQNKANLSIAYK